MKFSAYLLSGGPPTTRSRLRQRWIFNELLARPLPAETDEIDTLAAHLLLFGDLLDRIHLEAQQIQDILRYVAADPPTNDETRIAAILDGRYFVYTDVKQIIDLETGEKYDTAPAAVMETVAYDLNVVLRRCLQGVHNADQSSGSVD